MRDAGLGSYKGVFLDEEKTILKGGLTKNALASAFFVQNHELGQYINNVGIHHARLPEIIFGPLYSEEEFISTLDLETNPTWLMKRKRPVDDPPSGPTYADVAASSEFKRIWGDSDSDNESLSAADKFLEKCNSLVRGVKKLSTENASVEVPGGMLDSLLWIGDAIKTAAKIVGLDIKESATPFVVIGNTLIPKLEQDAPRLGEEEILFIELIQGLHAVRPLSGAGSKAELALAYLYGSSYQKCHYNMSSKASGPCLRANSHHVENLTTALQKISPRSAIFADAIIELVSAIISKGVARQALASEHMTPFINLDVWEEYISSLYVADSTLVEKLYPVATKKRLTREAKKKANTAGFQPRDKDYEPYTGVVKPEVDVSFVTLAADEKVAVKAVNAYLQRGSSGFSYAGDSKDQSARKKAALNYIGGLQTKAKAVTSVAQRRKGLVHARIVAARMENGDDARYAPSREEWDQHTQAEMKTEHKVLAALFEAFGREFVVSLVGKPT
jgi:hypothetical protein